MISPKVIDIENCRIGDEIISTHKAPVGTFAGGDADRGSDTSNYYNHIGRFPTQLFTNIDLEYNGIKKIK